MALRFRELLCDRTVLCCCFPVRAVVSVISLLGIIFSGILSILLWFEVASTHGMTPTERSGFVFAGVIDTSLLVAFSFGFVGAIISKQSFVQIYAYFTSGHLILNVSAATFLLYTVSRFPTTTARDACQELAQNAQAKDPCIVSLKIAKPAYFFITIIGLILELYGALVASHYARQLKAEKRNARRSRMVNEEAMRLVFSGKEAQYSDGQIARSPGLTFHPLTQVYNPYNEIIRSNHGAGTSSPYHNVPGPPVEAGYGGGLWTHEEISTEEKARLKEMDERMGLPELAASDVNHEGERIDAKSPMGPLGPPRAPLSEDLPMYAFRDPPQS